MRELELSMSNLEYSYTQSGAGIAFVSCDISSDINPGIARPGG
jgi:hypothetical protein